MEPCPHPGNSILPGNSTRGKRKGWAYSFSACSDRKEQKVWGQGKQGQVTLETSKSTAEPCTPPPSHESLLVIMVNTHEPEERESVAQDHPQGRRESKTCPASSARPPATRNSLPCRTTSPWPFSQSCVPHLENEKCFGGLLTLQPGYRAGDYLVSSLFPATGYCCGLHKEPVIEIGSVWAPTPPQVPLDYNAEAGG